MTDDEIRDLARENKLEAIKAYRERHRVGLKEAKDAIDYLVDTGRFPESPPPAAPQGGAASQDVDELLRQGLKIEAIKRYREQHGVGLKEAKDAVDARAAELGLASKMGCMALPMGLLVLAALAVGFTATLLH